MECDKEHFGKQKVEEEITIGFTVLSLLTSPELRTVDGKRKCRVPLQTRGYLKLPSHSEKAKAMVSPVVLQ